MPKMSRSQFAAAINDMWTLAQQTLNKRGAVYATLIALDPMGRQKILMQVPDPVADDLRNADVTVVPGPWTEHLDIVRATLREHKAVAAILYAEAWTVSDATAAETVRMNIAPHEHPMKDELLFSAGFWPREHLTHLHQATIARDNTGQVAGLVNYQHLTDQTNMVLVSWLEDLLPAAH